MIYLDYSATTPVNEEVLNTFVKVSKDFIGNSNSLHKLGVDSKKLEEASTKQIKELLNTDGEVIYTSGSSEANNLAIKGTCLFYQGRGRHIITDNYEHSSVYGPISYLEKLGFEVEYVKTLDSGIIDLEDLKNKLREDTILVSIASVNSEVGLLEPIEDIAKLLKNYNAYFHVDMTQSIGKVNISVKDIDLITFSAHKIYGIKGVGCLIKNNKVSLEPLIHGGKSTTEFRSGTPATALIASLAKALRLSFEDIDIKYKKVSELSNYLKDNLKCLDLDINSNQLCIPHIVNISVPLKPEVFIHALEEDGIYISTKSACSTSDISRSVLELTNDETKARNSVRISISHLTTKQEIDTFILKVQNILKHFSDLNG